ncbi:MAG TPA: efflux RND transporter periplasmic adaptor subunit [Gemmatimonadaceae bacterium]|nr:efflux RND transporter periplasmic adaptor subunit [Gemmatimonadaceae bacterium]
MKQVPSAMRVGPAVCAALVLAASCSKPQARPPRAPVTVAIVVARRADIPYMVEANGVVTPIQAAAVSAQVNGIVTRVAFREGQEVTKGQVLFQVDPRPYENAYQQALAAFRRDSASAANADAQRQRYRGLVKAQVITEEEAQQYETVAATTAATVESDRAAAATARFNLDNATVRAPIAGKTGSVLVRVGNLVSSGSGPLVVINQIRPIMVRFSVPSSELPNLQRYATNGGLPVTALPGGGTPASPSADSAQSESSPLAAAVAAQQGGGAVPEQGTLTFIDNAVDTTTGTVQLKATFANADGNLWVGQFASTRMRLYVEKGALVVPAQAVVSGQQGTYVYTLDADSKAQQHTVVVERVADGLAVIAAGVNEGDRVVTEGQSRLTPGAVASLRTTTGGEAPGAVGASAAARSGGGRRGGSAGAAVAPGGGRGGPAGR